MTNVHEPVGVGSPAWILDENRRIYVRADGTRSTSPLRASMWRQAVIVSETSRSWVIVLDELASRWEQLPGRLVHRLPKGSDGVQRGVAIDRQTVDDDIFSCDHRNSIVNAVQKASASKLREIARVVGYPAPE